MERNKEDDRYKKTAVRFEGPKWVSPSGYLASAPDNRSFELEGRDDTVKATLFNHTSNDDSFVIEPTSRQSANVGPVALKCGPMMRLVFEPQIVENRTEPANTVRGALIYEKKRKKEELYPSEKGEEPVSRQDVRTGDYLKLYLDASEMRGLYVALDRLYRLSKDMGSIPSWRTSYVEVDSASLALLNLLKSDASAARMLQDETNFELVKELLKLLTQGKSRQELSQVLSSLEMGSLHQLSTGLSLELFERAISDIENNFDNTNEEFWQAQILGKYPWIVEQLFSTPCVLLGSKVYLGGKSIENHGGNEADFIYRNELTSNVAIIEIKRPDSHLLGRSYRGQCYSLSSELSGAVNQVLSYKHSLSNELRNLQANSTKHFEAFNPQCVVILGCTKELYDEYGCPDKTKVGTFENFRSSINGVTIITYDELIQKIKGLVSLLKAVGPEAL